MAGNISKREMRWLTGAEESVDLGLWFVAERYRKWQGAIYPLESSCKWITPLSDPDLFLSFARLGAHGEPSDESILAWVHRHGLLHRQEPDFPYRNLANGLPNQARITLRRFKDEVRGAYGALTLLRQIRAEDFDGLRRRIRRETIYLHSPPDDWPREDGSTRYAEVFLDGRRIPGEQVMAEGTLSDEDTLAVALRGLERFIERKMREFGVGLAFTTDFHHPRPLSPPSRGLPQYRPRLTPRCPDLAGALWYQLAALVTDKRALRTCPECGLPFFGRADKQTCSPRCRKVKSRKTNADPSQQRRMT